MWRKPFSHEADDALFAQKVEEVLPELAVKCLIGGLVCRPGVGQGLDAELRVYRLERAAADKAAVDRPEGEPLDHVLLVAKLPAGIKLDRDASLSFFLDVVGKSGKIFVP